LKILKYGWFNRWLCPRRSRQSGTPLKVIQVFRSRMTAEKSVGPLAPQMDKAHICAFMGACLLHLGVFGGLLWADRGENEPYAHMQMTYLGSFSLTGAGGESLREGSKETQGTEVSLPADPQKAQTGPSPPARTTAEKKRPQRALPEKTVPLSPSVAPPEPYAPSLADGTDPEAGDGAADGVAGEGGEVHAGYGGSPLGYVEQSGGGGRAMKARDIYAARVRRRLDRYKVYPPDAARRRLRGVVVLKFTVIRDGTILDTRIHQSSGEASFDEEALALLQRVSPLPSLPAEIEGGRLRLTVPLNFSIR
jgi:protein TonB